MIIIAADPGNSTGLVWYNTDSGHLEVYTASSIQKLQSHLLYWRLANNARPNIVVAEDYIIRPGYAKAMIGNKLQAVRVLGALEWFAGSCKAALLLQQPSQKQAWPDDRLREYCDGIEIFTAHEKDALRHLYCLMTRTGIEF